MSSPAPDFEFGTDGPSLILVGVDGSRTSLRAAAYAGGLARRQDSRLLAVYVGRKPASVGAAPGGAALMSETFQEPRSGRGDGRPVRQVRPTRSAAQRRGRWRPYKTRSRHRRGPGPRPSGNDGALMLPGQQQCSIAAVTAAAGGGFQVAGRARGAHGAGGKGGTPASPSRSPGKMIDVRARLPPSLAGWRTRTCTRTRRRLGTRRRWRFRAATAGGQASAGPASKSGPASGILVSAETSADRPIPAAVS